ncbi:MAG TPA: Wzz/FepE/Etk N-terminal domain-containing protein [Dongiaceae bacterium]|nr:Wzz/FepE/Etk N-terminal domain-containing protein [Dongiaceae bacterium]
MAVFLPVFLLAVITSVLITFILPEYYASTARVKIMKPEAVDSAATTNFVSDPYFIQTELEVLQSQAILNPAIERLNLNLVWGHRFGGNTKLTTDECRQILDRMLELHVMPKTQLIEICVFDQDRDEAANLANAIAASYSDYHLRQLKHPPDVTDVPPVTIIDQAEPGQRPVRPNKPLNIGLGVLCGILLGGIAGSFTSWLAGRSRR